MRFLATSLKILAAVVLLALVQPTWGMRGGAGEVGEGKYDPLPMPMQLPPDAPAPHPLPPVPAPMPKPGAEPLFEIVSAHSRSQVVYSGSTVRQELLIRSRKADEAPLSCWATFAPENLHSAEVGYDSCSLEPAGAGQWLVHLKNKFIHVTQAQKVSASQVHFQVDGRGYPASIYLKSILELGFEIRSDSESPAPALLKTQLNSVKGEAGTFELSLSIQSESKLIGAQLGFWKTLVDTSEASWNTIAFTPGFGLTQEDQGDGTQRVRLKLAAPKLSAQTSQLTLTGLSFVNEGLQELIVALPKGLVIQVRN